MKVSLVRADAEESLAIAVGTLLAIQRLKSEGAEPGEVDALLNDLLDAAVELNDKWHDDVTALVPPVRKPQPFAPRSLAAELCERLGHDPTRVAQIVIAPDKIVVEHWTLLTRDAEVTVEPRRPQVGDRAEHKHLDSRRVVEVSEDGALVRLDFAGIPSDWLPAGNYTFTPGVKP